jgi:hypothetical protein
MRSENSPLPSGRKVTFQARWSSCHSFITKASLTETHTISSTPWALNAGANWL